MKSNNSPKLIPVLAAFAIATPIYLIVGILALIDLYEGLK